MFLESTQNQRCFNVEFDRWINVDKSTLNQHGYHVDRNRDVISIYISVESTLSVCWDFPQSYSRSKSKIKVTLFSSIYGTKSGLKGATEIDKSKVAWEADLAKLKPDADRLYIDKLGTTPTDWIELSNVGRNYVVKKNLYDELVKKVNAID